MKIVKNKWVLALAAVSIASLTVATAAAQRPDRGPGGGFGRRGGFGFGGGGASSLMLAGSEAVQAELKVTEEQKTALDETRREMFQGFRRGGDGERPSREDFQARMAEQEKKVNSILNEEQQKRLTEIRYQVMGIPGILRDEGASKELNVTAEQRQTVDGLMDEQREAMQELREAVEVGAVAREAMGEEMEKLRKEMEEKSTAVLTEEQQAKVKEMMGKPFDVAQLRGPGGRRGPGGAGDPPGGRRRGDRSRNEA